MNEKTELEHVELILRNLIAELKRHELQYSIGRPYSRAVQWLKHYDEQNKVS